WGRGLPERLGGAAASPHGAARQPGCRCGALSAGQRGRRSRSGSSVTGIGASPDGNAKGAGDGGSSSSLSVSTLTLPEYSWLD
uniref:Uncharacterized protein n=1 Tax=Oryza glaberrima TaxID=4538 RepID=I1P1J9_ORYGL